jgi:hypothetical protein
MIGRDLTIQFLRAFIHRGARPGDLIELGPIRFPVQEHFSAAMDHAAEQGWVDKSDAGQYRLTEAGFAMVKVSK